jgi:hypothetical protein
VTTPSDTPSPADAPVDAPADAPVEAGVAPVVRPPAKLLLAYRLLGVRLPEEYHPWVLHDAAAKTFLTWRSLRTFLWGEALVGLAFLGYYLRLDRWPTRAWQIRAELVVLAVVLFSSRDALVRRTLRWHRIDKHGRPVAKVKPFARLSNLEAVALGVAVLALTTGVGAAVGEAQKPRGIAALPCREAEPAVFDRIRAGAPKDQKYLTTRMVRYGPQDDIVIAALVPDPADEKKATFEAWVVRGERIERVVEKDDTKTTTRFPKVSTPVDKQAVQAVERVARCLFEKPAR